jgi:hypothetical protein
MKNFFILVLMVFVTEAFAVCSSPISRANNSASSVLTSTKYNLDLNTVYGRANELPGDCISSGTLTSTQISDGTIVDADISASAAISHSKIQATNYAISLSSGSYENATSSFTDALSVSITTVGRPVEISLINGAGFPSQVYVFKSGATEAAGLIKLLRDSTEIDTYELSISGASGFLKSSVPVGAVKFFDTPASGSHTYKIQGASALSSTLGISDAKLLVREL